MHKNLVRYFDSFIALETYICMTSMMMLGITNEVSINKSLPIKGKTQAKLRHSWSFLRMFGNSWTLFGILDTFGIGFGKTLLF